MNEQQKFQSKRTMIIVTVLCACLFGLAVAYAALSTTLSITFNNVTQQALTWNVAFQGSSATAEASGTSATGRTCGTATITADSVSLADTTLSKPGDKCTYTLTVKNSGTVAATLATITPTSPTGIACETATSGNLVCGNITYKLTSDSTGSTLLPTGTTLAAGASQTIYLVAMYNADTLQSTAVTQNGAKFSLIYNQA